MADLLSGYDTRGRAFHEEAVRVLNLEILSLQVVRDRLADEFDQAVELILSATGKVVVTGLGKSGIVGHKISATLASTGTPAVFMNASEALHGDLGMVNQGDIVLMVSNSGRTGELLRMLPSLRHLDAKLIGLLGSTSTRLAKECDLVIDTGVEHEACPLDLAPTASSTVTMAVGDALACALMKARGFSPDRFAVNHPGGSLGRRLLMRARDVMVTGVDLATGTPQSTVRQIAILLTQSSLGAVCICSDESELLGIVTDGDLRRHLTVSSDLEITAANLMTPTPTSAHPDDTLDKLVALMESPGKKVYVLPIVEPSNRLVGMVRMHDILSD